MNLILLEDEDFVDREHVRIAGRRFRHIIDIHRAREGDERKVGVVGGRIGQGRIIRLEKEFLEMEVALDLEPPRPLPVTVILALPRPKVMRRALYSLTVLGVKKVIVMNAARVEKSYWQTPYLEPLSVRRQLMLGLEQSGDTILPEVLLRPLFRPFVEDELPGLSQGTLAFAAHPIAAEPCPRDVRQPVTLAIGPEGGFVPFEIDALRAQGFSAVTMGPRIMNIEAAIPSLLARLF